MKIFTGKFLIFFFLFSLQNIACGYPLEPPRVLTSTYNLCFGAKIRKIGIPLQTPVLLYKSGVQGGNTFHGYVSLIKTLSVLHRNQKIPQTAPKRTESQLKA